jgi:hypothetical protein
MQSQTAPKKNIKPKRKIKKKGKRKKLKLTKKLKPLTIKRKKQATNINKHLVLL